MDRKYKGMTLIRKNWAVHVPVRLWLIKLPFNELAMKASERKHAALFQFQLDSHNMKVEYSFENSSKENIEIQLKICDT